MIEKAKKTEQKINRTIQPIVMLSDEDKLFLAATRHDDAKFAYVLTLVYKRDPSMSGISITLNPIKEVYTFKSKLQADAFYGSVQQMIKMGKESAPSLFKMQETSINSFNENVR